jgi:hypothetical protein
MRRLALVAAILFSGCSTSSSGVAVGSPSPTSIASPGASPLAVARQILPPARSLPLVALCSQPIATQPDGNAAPLLCTNGALNVLAWKHYAPFGARVLGAGRGATLESVKAALCRDVNLSHTAIPIELSAHDLASAYYGWNFDSDPTEVLSTSSCPR